MSLAARARRPQAEAAPSVRVAIYTRKSVTEGLDQAFNSLDAQREAVEAYTASQRGLGWVALPEHYDDGGFSGKNTDRPAFQRLIRDVEAGKVDVVACYKLDRLSRSLLDFTQLLALFRRHGVGFVSVTQSFDTSTPIGRMVVNLLATFAEFERETIAERTRDKIAATRRRGAWTGGRPILGYDVVNKKLVVNEPEAERVRAVFELYLELGSIIAVVQELVDRGWTTKSWVTQEGKHMQGFAFTKGTVHDLLRNPLYIGKIRSGEELHDGAHEAIVDQHTFDAAQAQLRANLVNRRPAQSRSSALLAGLLRCSCGWAMTYHYTCKGERTYGYYTCLRAQKQGVRACRGRAAAGALEQFVVERLRAVGRDPSVLAATVEADRADRESRRPEATALARRLEAERTRLQGERGHVVEAISKGAVSLVGQLAELDERLADADRRAQAARGELAALDLGGVDADELRRRLEDLAPVWEELFPKERARVLSLLVERIRFDHASGEVQITLRQDRASRGEAT